MRKLFYLTFLIVTVYITACAKDENPTGTPSTNNNEVVNSFVINGDGYSSVECRGATQEDAAFAFVSEDDNSVTISAYGTIGGVSTTRFSITFVLERSGTGTFTLGGETPNSYSLTLLDGGSGKPAAIYVPTNGSITVTQFDAVGGRLRATFSGEAQNAGGNGTLSITNGRLDCKVVEEVK